MILDLEFTRQQFPAFTEPSLDGWAFFENAGGSYACRQVIERLTDFYTRTKVQPYYDFPASKAAGDAMDESYRRLAELLDVETEELQLGPSTSQNTYVLANAMRAMWQEGDEIIVTNQDHEANGGVWRRLEATGIVVREWQIDPDNGTLDPADLESLFNDRTRLLAFPHCSNVIGHINPVHEITALARAAGALTVVDGVSYAPHGLPDVAALGCDVYLFSLYKTWGPHLGLMTVKRELLERLPNQSHYFNADNLRKKLLPAGPDHAQIAAAAGIADYYDASYQHHFDDLEHVHAAERARRLHDLFRGHEQTLLTPLLEFLAERTDVRLIGPADSSIRAPTVTILPTEKTVAEVGESLGDHKMMVGTGHFYAARALEAMGIDSATGVVRLSFVHYTAPQEVDRLIAALDKSL
jgi:cysteine desulfurase family protein (TIGR01976 family)